MPTVVVPARPRPWPQVPAKTALGGVFLGIHESLHRGRVKKAVRCFGEQMAPFATKMALASGCFRRALSTATLGRAATLGRETDAADFWRRSQDGVVLPELSAQLEAPIMAKAGPAWPASAAKQPRQADWPRQPEARPGVQSSLRRCGWPEPEPACFDARRRAEGRTRVGVRLQRRCRSAGRWTRCPRRRCRRAT